MTEVEAGAGAPTPPSSPSTPPAPPAKKPRARYIVAAVACAVIVVWMFTVLQNSAVYLRPVSEAVERRDEQGTKRFRMAGTVVPGTIGDTSDGARFDVTEGGATVAVVHHGDPPDLFRNCAPVVVEGTWNGTTFDSDRLLIRHGSEYDASERTDSAACEDGAQG
jgi:cytochrome c-type biogenesis protein CcmE